MAAVDIHVFHCGQGDTLLIRLDGAKWILLDCNLPGRKVDRFIELLEDLGVTRLDLVCLSHLDRDHYTGMRQLLDHYSQPPRELGVFCDGGFAVKLTRPESSAHLNSEVVALYRRMNELRRAGLLKYLKVAAHHDLRAESPGWPGQVSVLSPQGSNVHLANLEVLIEGRRDSANEHSLVLVVESGDPVSGFRGLLPGDANGETLTAALLRFPDAAAKRFDFVKVSHHGSWKSHQGSPVCGCIRAPDISTAVISSSRMSQKLPRREVLNDYMNAGWRVYDTGRRGEPRFGLTLFNLIAWTESMEGAHDVSVRWTPEEGLSAGPEAARVTPDDIALYASRADSDV